MVEIGINQEEIEAEEKENLETAIRGMKGTEKNLTVPNRKNCSVCSFLAYI